jgi:hypothetical protein
VPEQSCNQMKVLLWGWHGKVHVGKLAGAVEGN